MQNIFLFNLLHKKVFSALHAHVLTKMYLTIDKKTLFSEYIQAYRKTGDNKIQ